MGMFVQRKARSRRKMQRMRLLLHPFRGYRGVMGQNDKIKAKERYRPCIIDLVGWAERWNALIASPVGIVSVGVSDEDIQRVI